jgi:hypothetical protein
LENDRKPADPRPGGQTSEWHDSSLAAGWRIVEEMADSGFCLSAPLRVNLKIFRSAANMIYKRHPWEVRSEDGVSPLLESFCGAYSCSQELR